MTSERFGAVCAVLFAVLFLAGFAFLELPGHDDDEQLLNKFYSDGGNRLRVILGAYSWGLAGVALLGLGAVLSSRAERAGTPVVVARLMLLSCAGAAVLLMAAGAAQAPTYALSIDAFDEPESELTRATIPHIGHSLLLFAMLAAAAFCASVSAAIRATGMLPQWLAWIRGSSAASVQHHLHADVRPARWAILVGVSLWRGVPTARRESAT